MGEYKRVSANLSHQAHRGWDRACHRRGVSFTAMIEAIGQLLDEHDWLPDEVGPIAAKSDRERRRKN